MNEFLYEADFVVSVCDRNGTIIYMNQKAEKIFEEDGGRDLIGSDILDCHPEPSKSQLKEMMTTHETQTIFKGNGPDRRMIHQTPIYKNGEFDGYIELIIPIP